ncbi:Ribonuclease P protein component [subsurface metagenome]
MKKKDFDNVFKKGKSKAGKLVFLKMLKNNLEANRFGIIVSTKISKKAVHRNKIKRRIREIIRQAGIETGFDIVVVAKPKIINKNYQEIKNDLENLFQNL